MKSCVYTMITSFDCYGNGRDQWLIRGWGQENSLNSWLQVCVKLLKLYHRHNKRCRICSETRHSSLVVKQEVIENSNTLTHPNNRTTLTIITSFSFFPLTGCSTLQQFLHHFKIKVNLEINKNSRMVLDFFSYKSNKNVLQLNHVIRGY